MHIDMDKEVDIEGMRERVETLIQSEMTSSSSHAPRLEDIAMDDIQFTVQIPFSLFICISCHS